MLRNRCTSSGGIMHVKHGVVFLRAILCSILLFQAGCVTSDSHISEQLENKRGSYELNGTFVNSPVYQTESFGFIGTRDFGFALGVYVDADIIRLSLTRGSSLYVALEKDEKKVFEKTYYKDDGLKFNNDGIVTLPSQRNGGSGDSPGIGYSSHQFNLFINKKGNLVLIQSGGGGGLVGVIPFAVYGSLMSIFPRKSDMKKEPYPLFTS